MYEKKIYFSSFSAKLYDVGTQKNPLIETVLLITQNMLKLMGKKILPILRSFFLSKPVYNANVTKFPYTEQHCNSPVGSIITGLLPFIIFLGNNFRKRQIDNVRLLWNVLQLPFICILILAQREGLHCSFNHLYPNRFFLLV